MFVRLLLAAFGVLLLFFMLPPAKVAAPVQEVRLGLGTVITVKLYVGKEEAGPLMELAFGEIARVESLMSHRADRSELTQINRRAAAGPVSCSPEMVQVLKRSLYFARRSGGAFDPTVGALTQLWNFPDARTPPPAAQIDSARALVGYRYLQVHDAQVRFLRAGVRLDLGAVAKGFAVDRAAERLRRAGVKSGLIEAGGDIRFWGVKPDGRPWRFGVQHPRAPQRLVEVEDLGLAALATSGDYEQFFEYEGERFHHLLDPATGYPARRAFSATAWAQTAMDADILSTAVFVLGPRRGLELVETLPRAEALVIYEEEGHLRHRASSGAQGRLHFGAHFDERE